MITTLLFDFSRVLLFPMGEVESLNGHYRDLQKLGNFNFFSNFELNTQLLDYLAGIKDRFGLYILTSGQIQKDPALTVYLNKTFKGVFSAEDLGLDKQDSYAYSFITRQKLGIKPENVMFIDDQEVNISAAAKEGLATHLYKENADLIAKIDSLPLS